MIQSAPRTSALPLYTVLEEEYRQLGKIAPGAPPPTTWRLVA